MAIPRLAARIAPRWSSEERSNVSRAVAGALDAIGDGVQEALGLLRARDGRLLGGAIGYLAFDIAVFWASFRAFGAAPPLAGLLLAYLLGQLGSLIPIPGGIGGVEAGLVGALVLYGTPVAQATVGVILYRAVLLITPATLGGLAFVQLKRSPRDHAAARIPCADDLPPVATARSS